jgi:hypothetical protein
MHQRIFFPNDAFLCVSLKRILWAGFQRVGGELSWSSWFSKGTNIIKMINRFTEKDEQWPYGSNSQRKEETLQHWLPMSKCIQNLRKGANRALPAHCQSQHNHHTPEPSHWHQGAIPALQFVLSLSQSSRQSTPCSGTSLLVMPASAICSMSLYE